MSALPRLVLATRNLGKVDEFARLLGDAFVLEPVPEDVDLPEETGQTFEENARLKAAGVVAALGGPTAVLADDSGLEVAALEGRPGVRSARYAGDNARDEDNVRKLLGELHGQADRRARFVCALCLALPAGLANTVLPRLVEVQGTVDGTIVGTPRGAAGFGYDPVFQPRGTDKTLAEASPASKDRVSHRGAAVKALLLCLREDAWLQNGP